jgi:hypothetical protein
MARIARDIALFALPADAPLTPGTCDQVIARTQRGEVLSVFSVLPLKSKQMRFAPLVALLQHIGTGSSIKVRAGGQPLKKRPSPCRGAIMPTEPQRVTILDGALPHRPPDDAPSTSVLKPLVALLTATVPAASSPAASPCSTLPRVAASA